MGFSIIIVTWNGLHHLKTFLPDVVKTNYSDYEIIIADNNSTDGTKEWLRANYPDVIIAEFDDNYGYTGGNNRAVPFATKDTLIFLNNDVKPSPDWLHGLATVFDEYEDVAAAQPKILSFNDPEYFEYAGAAGGYLDKLAYPYCRGRILDTIEMDEGQYDDQTEIVWASGAALAIRKDVFIEAGGFDEDFQFHMEEIDLCWRILNKGYKIMYTPKSRVYHLGGGSLPMGSSRKVYFNFRNSLYILFKNLPKNELWWKFLFRIKLDIVAALRSLLTGKLNETAAIVKAHWHFWRNFGMIRKKRAEMTFNRSNDVLTDRLIIVDYFLKGIKKYSDLT